MYKKGNTGRSTTASSHYVVAGQMTQINDSFKISIEPLLCPCWELQISDLAATSLICLVSLCCHMSGRYIAICFREHDWLWLRGSFCYNVYILAMASGTNLWGQMMNGDAKVASLFTSANTAGSASSGAHLHTVLFLCSSGLWDDILLLPVPEVTGLQKTPSVLLGLPARRATMRGTCATPKAGQLRRKSYRTAAVFL